MICGVCVPFEGLLQAIEVPAQQIPDFIVAHVLRRCIPLALVSMHQDRVLCVYVCVSKRVCMCMCIYIHAYPPARTYHVHTKNAVSTHECMQVGIHLAREGARCNDSLSGVPSNIGTQPFHLWQAPCVCVCVCVCVYVCVCVRARAPFSPIPALTDASCSPLSTFQT